jgi:p24 family protein beta-1
MVFGMLLSALTLTLLTSTACGVNFELPSGREECFYEDVHEGTSINGAFAVVAGAHLDVDVFVWAPDGRQLYAANHEGEGNFAIRADRDGTYKFCFSNKMSVMSHKVVRLALNLGEPIDLNKLAKKESMENIERWILSISHTVRMIDFHQQEYSMLHDRHLNSMSSCRLWATPLRAVFDSFSSLLVELVCTNLILCG